jgi:hypothetical protein
VEGLGLGRRQRQGRHPQPLPVGGGGAVAGQQVGRGGSLGTSGGQGDQQDTGCGQPAAVVEQVWVGVLVHGDSLATMFDTQSDGWLKPPGRAQCSLPSRLQLPEPAHP